jgi:hypothetical protein
MKRTVYRVDGHSVVLDDYLVFSSCGHFGIADFEGIGLCGDDESCFVAHDGVLA